MTGPAAELAVAFARRVHELATNAAHDDRRCSIAIPGGSVAEAFLPALAGLAVDWSRVDVWWVDERAVPPDDAESNYGLAKRLWFDPTRLPGPVVHRMPADAPDLDDAARQYEQALTSVNGRPPVIDIALLGVGPDGHIASLFPDHPALEVKDRAVVAVFDSPKPPSRRLTLTMPVLVSARAVVIAAFGTGKAGAIREASTGTSQSPLAKLLRAAPHAELWTDFPLQP